MKKTIEESKTLKRKTAGGRKGVMVAILITLFSGCEVIPEIIPVITDVVTVAFDPLPDTDLYPDYGSRMKWQKTNLSYYIHSYADGIPVSEQDQIIRQALDTWAYVTNLSFYEVNSAGQADLVIGFGSYGHCELYSAIHEYCDNSSAFDGPSQVLAHAYFPGQGVISGDAHFDADEFWTTSNTDPSSISLLSVAVHELGHSLGLDHSPDELAVMYASYDGNNIKTQLGQDDIQRIQALYGSSGRVPEQPEIPSEPEIPTSFGCGSPTYEDSDGDGIDDFTEWYVIGTNPWECDTDGDGLPDSEINYYLDPLNPDTDGDGVTDGDEIAMGTNPLKPDQGTASSGIQGVYVGSDSYGSPIAIQLESDGSATGILRITYFGMSTDITLTGGLDVYGDLVLVSGDYYFAYYGQVQNGSIEGIFQTTGGATGTWSAHITNGSRLNPETVQDNDLVSVDRYTPVPDERKEVDGPVHNRVHWRDHTEH